MGALVRRGCSAASRARPMPFTCAKATRTPCPSIFRKSKATSFAPATIWLWTRRASEATETLESAPLSFWIATAATAISRPEDQRTHGQVHHLREAQPDRRHHLQSPGDPERMAHAHAHGGAGAAQAMQRRSCGARGGDDRSRRSRILRRAGFERDQGTARRRGRRRLARELAVVLGCSARDGEAGGGGA